MCILTRRLQILLDEERYARLERAAQKSHRSVAAAVREAIDLAYPADLEEKRQASDAILSAPQIEVPDIEELKRELEALRAGEP
jgi:predicted DNA-binding protein